MNSQLSTQLRPSPGLVDNRSNSGTSSSSLDSNPLGSFDHVSVTLHTSSKSLTESSNSLKSSSNTLSLNQHRVSQSPLGKQENAPLSYPLLRAARFAALSTREQLIQTAGRPKDNISFGVFGSKKMSTEYKAVLNGLDAYHNSAQTADTSTNPQEALESRLKVLEELENAVDQYGNKSSHTRTEQIKQLKSSIANERTVLQILVQELKNGAELPHGAKLSDTLAYSREGVSLKDMAEPFKRGFEPHEARMYVGIQAGLAIVQASPESVPVKNNIKIGLHEQFNEIVHPLKQDYSQLSVGQKNALYTEAGFNEAEMVLLEQEGLGVEFALSYKQLGLPRPISASILSDLLMGEQARSDMTELGSGAFNTAYQFRCAGPQGDFDAVFKPLSHKDSSSVGEHIGIDYKNARQANRNLATCQVAQALGFDVVARTRLGCLTHPNSAGKPELGLVMEKAQGKSLGNCGLAANHGAVIRELTKLQLLDQLTGQGDRHRGNYFVDIQGSGNKVTVKVTGIDNDLCFGSKNSDSPESFVRTESNDFFHGVKLPPLIDQDMLNAFNQLTPESLKEMLSDKLTEAEINSATQRLVLMKKHFEKLKENDMVIQVHEWETTQKMQGQYTAVNSYATRDQSTDFGF